MKTNKKFENPNPRCTHSGVLDSSYEIWYLYVIPFFRNRVHSHTDGHILLLYKYIDIKCSLKPRSTNHENMLEKY